MDNFFKLYKFILILIYFSKYHIQTLINSFNNCIYKLFKLKIETNENLSNYDNVNKLNTRLQYYSNSFVPVTLPFRYIFVRRCSLAVSSKFLTVPGPFPHRSGLKKAKYR